MPVFFHLLLSFYSVNGWHSAGGQCSTSCECSLQCKTIFHSFWFPLFIYSQLHRPLLCILSLVWLILLYISSFSPFYGQLSSSVLNIPSGLFSKAPIPVMALPRPGKFISRPSVHWLIKNWTTTWCQWAAMTGSPCIIAHLKQSVLNSEK